MITKKIFLGTANLGMAYGITNPQEFDIENSKKVLNTASELGITAFDTAPGYGMAEELLSSHARMHGPIQLITKIPASKNYSFENISMFISKVRQEVMPAEIYGLLFHDPEAHEKKEVKEISKRILGEGLVSNLGFSAYDLGSIVDAKKRIPEWNFFQVPENILDQRLYNSQYLLEQSKIGDIFLVRSIFLQGLLLSPVNKLNAYFGKYTNEILELNTAAALVGLSALDLCMNYAQSIPWSSGTLIAAGSSKQLKEIVQFKKSKFDFGSLRKLDEQILDPRKWII